MSRGNPKFEIRVAQSRRETWQRAADIEKRSLSDFVRIATDERAKRIILNYDEYDENGWIKTVLPG